MIPKLACDVILIFLRLGLQGAALVCALIALAGCGENLDLGKDTDVIADVECSMFGGKPDCEAPADWARVLTPRRPCVFTAMSIASDAKGNGYVFSSLQGTVTLGDRKVGVEEGQTALLVSYTPDGDVRWTREIDGGYASAVALAGDHVCVFGGDAEGHPSLGKLLDPGLKGHAFLACYDLSGADVWSRRIDGWTGNSTAPMPMAGDSQGNLYLAGTFSEALEVAAGLTAEAPQLADAPSPPSRRRRRELQRGRGTAISSHIRGPGRRRRQVTRRHE